MTVPSVVSLVEGSPEPRMLVLDGDCLALMPTLEAESVDAIMTDPPYGLAFMGKAWDHGVPGVPFWEAMLRVAKPGAYLVAFGGTRTYHRLTCAVEDAGWEIRDCLSWLYGSGFPKSHNGAWGGTALKPAWEPIILARKPLIGTVAANVTQYGTGGLNVDGCRVAATGEPLGGGRVSSRAEGWDRPWKADPSAVAAAHERGAVSIAKAEALGRWPANVCLDPEAAALLDEQTGDSKSRFFYCAKASRAEREEGLEDAVERADRSLNLRTDSHAERTGNLTARAANHHPTVKPVSLMRWLCRLVTPPGGLILDPFTGSGSTGVAAAREGFRFLGMEREPEYVAIATARIAKAVA